MNNFRLNPGIGETRRGQEIGKFCGHQYIWLACTQCGEKRWVEIVKMRQVNYTGLCRRCNRKIGGWRRIKGANPHGEGRTIKGGYIEIHLEPNDFFYPMVHSKGYVLEHRLIMAKHLNRCLLPWEIIHHKGTKYPMGSVENRSDNRIENLELLPTGKRHLPSMRWLSELKSRDKKIAELEKRVTLLEAENVLLRSKEGVAWLISA